MWREVIFSDIAQIAPSNVDKKSLDGEKAVRLCNYMDAYQNRFIKNNFEFMEATASAAEITKFSLQKNDVVFTKDSETPEDIAVSSVVSEELTNVVCGYHLAIARPKEGMSGKFLMYRLWENEVHKQFFRVANGSTRYGLTIGSISNVSITIPEYSVQNKIAKILESVDSAIEKTQALIDKYENIKQGMMQDLFTRGVNENGQLRPSYEDAPHLYQETEIGWIPENWGCSDISMYLEPSDGIKPGPFGSSIKKDMYTSSGYRVYGQEQVIAGTLTIGDYYVSSAKYSEMSVFSVKAGDVLVSLVGTIGHVLVIPSKYEEGIINPRLMRFRVNKKVCDPYFLRFLLLDSSVSHQLERFATGGTMPVLSGKIFKKVSMPIIPKGEQRKITEILTGTEEKILSLSKEHNKLIQIKLGLMQDLLTGKVRVAEDKEERKEAVA